MDVKNFIRVGASCLLALFCVMETKPKPILQPKEKVNQARTQKWAALQESTCASLFCVQGFVLPLLSTRADPHTEYGWQMCWNSGEGWWPQYSLGAPFPDQDCAAELHGSCQSVLGEQCVWASWNLLPSGEICSCHPTPSTCKWLIPVWT